MFEPVGRPRPDPAVATRPIPTPVPVRTPRRATGRRTVLRATIDAGRATWRAATIALLVLDWSVAYAFLVVAGAALAPVAGALAYAAAILPGSGGADIQAVGAVLLDGALGVGPMTAAAAVVFLPLAAVLLCRTRSLFPTCVLGGAVAGGLGSPLAPAFAGLLHLAPRAVPHGFAAAMGAGALCGLATALIARDPPGRRDAGRGLR